MRLLRRIGSLGRGHRMVPAGRVTILIQAALAIGFVAFLMIGDGMRAPWAKTYEVEAAFDDATGLNAADEPRVSVAGVEVGKVSEVRYEDGKAVVTLAIEDENARELLRADATADLAPRSALNDLTVDLTPGDSRKPLQDGVRIPAAGTQSQVPLDELVGVLDADTRAWAQVLLGELEPALRGRSDELAAGLRQLGALTEPAKGVAAALAERRRLVVRLIGETSQVFDALGDSGTELAEVVRTGRATLDVTGAREAELSGAFRRLPSTLAALDGALREVRALSVPLDPALERLRPFARELPGGLAALDDFVPTARALVGDLGPLAREGRAPVRALRGALETLGSSAGDLAPATRDLRGALAAIDEQKAGIKTLGENFSGVFSTNDANGPLLRGLGYFEAFRCENFGFSGGMFPNCGPPAGSSAPAGLRGLSPPQMVLAALLSVCSGSRGAAPNQVACLVAFYSPETVRELPSLANSAAGRRALERATGVLSQLLPADSIARLRERLSEILPTSEVELVLPGTAPVTAPEAPATSLEFPPVFLEVFDAIKRSLAAPNGGRD